MHILKEQIEKCYYCIPWPHCTYWHASNFHDSRQDYTCTSKNRVLGSVTEETQSRLYGIWQKDTFSLL